MDEKPARVLQSDTIFEGRIFTVKKDRVHLPSGKEASLEVVRHPGSVVLLPMVDETHIVLVRQYRYAVDRWVWELAAGTIEPGEKPEIGAARECQEEIGLIPGKVEFLGAFYPTPGYCDEKMNYYRLTGLREPGAGDAAAHPDEDEDIRVRTFSLDQVRAMIASNEILDLKTAIALELIR